VLEAKGDGERRAAYARLRREHPEAIVPQGGATTVDLVLPSLVRLRGRYRVAGAAPGWAGWITLTVAGDPLELGLRHDADGDFVALVEPGTWLVRAPDSDGTETTTEHLVSDSAAFDLLVER
jgi:hypothetical protein